MRLLLTTLVLLGSLVQVARARPNIVFIFTDDQAPLAVNAAGDKRFITPNIDRIFHEGAQLVNSFVTTPVCSPSRVGLIEAADGGTLFLDEIGELGRRRGLVDQAGVDADLAARQSECIDLIVLKGLHFPLLVRCHHASDRP